MGIKKGNEQMQMGRLYKLNEEQFVTDINYRLLGDTPRSVSGELIPTEYGSITDNESYIVELEDNQKFRCNLKKNVNRPTVGLPPRFVYRFACV